MFPFRHSLTRRSFLAAAPATLLMGSRRLAAAATAAATGQGNAPREVVLTLLHTNDIHGRILLPGQPQGLARIGSLVRQVRAEMPHVLLLEAGDIIHGTPEERAFDGHSSIAAMNALGYDAATAGNHEFDFGQKVTAEAFRRARFPMLSANVLDVKTGKPWGRLKPYTILEKGGVRVAVFGLTTPTTVDIQWPRTLAGIRFADPIEVARELVPRLRQKERADVVVFLSHLGYQPDREFAQAVTGVDIILGGHSHTLLAEQVWVNGTLIMQTGAYGSALGRADLLVQPGSDKETGCVLAINGSDGRWWGRGDVPAPLTSVAFPDRPLYPVTDSVLEDPAIVAAYRPFAERLRPVLDEALTLAAEPLPAADIRTRETALGNLLADAVRVQGKAEIGLAAGSQVDLHGLEAGPVTVRALYVLLGAYTRQHLVTVRSPGARIREMLTIAVGDGQARVHLSGLRRGDSATGDWIVTDTNALLDDAQSYTVTGPAHVIQDYLYKREGVTIRNDDVGAPTLRDSAIAFLRGRAPLQNRLEIPPRLPAPPPPAPKAGPDPQNTRPTS